MPLEPTTGLKKSPTTGEKGLVVFPFFLSRAGVDRVQSVGIGPDVNGASLGDGRVHHKYATRRKLPVHAAIRGVEGTELKAIVDTMAPLVPMAV